MTPTKAQKAANDDALASYHAIAGAILSRRRAPNPYGPKPRKLPGRRETWLHLAVAWEQPWGRKPAEPKALVYR